METLTTKRIILRDFAPTDAEDFFAYAKSPKVGPMAGWIPHENMEESKKWIRSFNEAQEVWAIEHRKTGKVIGSIGLHRETFRNYPMAMTLGYVLSEDFWGQGLMVEGCQRILAYGFNTLQLNLIEVHHFAFNLQSKRVIEKLGFTYEGTLRQGNLLPDGSYTDLCCYSMTKEEYFTLSPLINL